MNVNPPKLLVHWPLRFSTRRDVLDVIERTDPCAPIRRNWDRAIASLESSGMSSVDVVIDVLEPKGIRGLEHLREVWKLRVRHNYTTVPVYFALSCVDQPAALKYEIQRLGGHYLHISDVSRHFDPQLDEIRLQLAEVRRAMPRWDIVEEYWGADPRRVYVILQFNGKPVHVSGSDRHLAVLAVLLKNNGIPRSLKSIRDLCSEDPLFAPSGGPFAVPQLSTLKMYIYRDYPKHLQRSFDKARSGYRADRIIEHVDLGVKPFGFRIRGTSTVTVR